MDTRFRQALTAECGLGGLETLDRAAAGQGNIASGAGSGKEDGYLPKRDSVFLPSKWDNYQKPVEIVFKYHRAGLKNYKHHRNL